MLKALISRKRNALVQCLAAFLAIGMQVHATTYYSRSSGANWSVNNSWSTVTYGGAAATSHPVAGDTVNIANGITIFVNTTSACSVINIGQGTSGILQFGSTGNFTLTVSNDITVNNGAKLYYNSNNARTHTLKIGGDLTNNGLVDLVYDVNDRVNITFNGSSNSIVSGSGTWSLNNVTLNKTGSSSSCEVQSTSFESAINSLVATSGTYIHNNSSTYSINASFASNFVISESVVFKVPQGTVWFSPNSSSLFLEGSLYVNGGNVFVGTTVGNNGLIYRQPASFIPYLEVSSGILDVYGGIYNNLADPFSFRMTGGNILLNNGSTGTSQGVFYQNDLAGSVFDMSGGTITLEKHNLSGGTNVDWAVCGNNGLVTTTGGTVQFGDNATTNGTVFDFMPFPNVVQPNFKITGASGSAITLRTTQNATADFKLLSIYIDVNKTLDIRSIFGANGDAKNMTLTDTYDEVHAFYCDGLFTARTGTVTLAGGASQSIGGSSITTFYNLTIASSSNITLENQERVSNLLTMSSGKLMTTSANILTCTASANATIGTASSYVDGPMKHTIAISALTSKNYPIGNGDDYRPAVLSVKHSNAVSVTYRGEVINSPASGLGYSLPSTITKVSGVRYWNFVRQNVPNFTNATIKLYYDLDDSVTDRMKVSVVHDDGSSNWLDLGGTGTANNAGSITSTSITSFKTKFALGFPPSSLPIELVNFDVKKSGSDVLCLWTTASEINNDYFTIERSSDGIAYDSILTVEGAGNSTHPLHYQAWDENPLNGTSYYRLRQTNFDGSSAYSDPVSVTMEISYSSYKIFPNPSDGNSIFISKNGEGLGDVLVTVYDMTGNEMKASATLSGDKREIQLNINSPENGKEGFYILSLLKDRKSVMDKILVTKH